jgi:hypothetical protein
VNHLFSSSIYCSSPQHFSSFAAHRYCCSYINSYLLRRCVSFIVLFSHSLLLFWICDLTSVSTAHHSLYSANKPTRRLSTTHSSVQQSYIRINYLQALTHLLILFRCRFICFSTYTHAFFRL